MGNKEYDPQRNPKASRKELIEADNKNEQQSSLN